MNSVEKISSPASVTQAEIDLVFLSRIFAFFWQNKITYGASGVIAILAAALWMHVSPVIVQAEMTLLPNPNESSSDSSKTSSLGSLLDLGLGPGDSPNFVKFVETLRSYRLAERLQDRHQYLQRAFSSRWNKAEKKWAPSSSILYFARQVFLGRPTKEPDITSLQDYIKSHITVDEDKKTHSVIIRLRSSDPVLAVDLLRDIQEEADLLIREDNRDYTQHAIGYLDSALRGITAEEHRLALTNLLIGYERTLILISDSEQPFASIVVDPPILSSSPVSPKAAFVYPGFFFGSWLVATIIISRRSRQARDE